MNRKRAVQLVATFAVFSFFRVLQSFQRYSFTDQPRLSCCLLLFISGLYSYGLSFLAKFIPTVTSSEKLHRRTESQDGPLLVGTVSEEALQLHEDLSAHIPLRAGKWAMPVLAICIAIRFELVQYLSHQQQCATPGVESFLSVILVIHDIFASRTRLGWVAPQVDNEPIDPWRSVFEDLRDWFLDARGTMVLVLCSTLTFALGTFASLRPVKNSTYFCFEAVDSRTNIVLLQALAMLLDATCIILAWRIVAWCRNLGLKLRAIAGILTTAGAMVSLVGLRNAFSADSANISLSFVSVHMLEVIMDSLLFVCMVASIALWTCETSPLVPTSVITVIVGMLNISESIFRAGDWLRLSSPFTSLLHMYLVGCGAIIFTYTYNLRSVVFVRRIFFVILVLLLLVTTTITCFVKKPQVFKRHPVNELIFNANTAFSKWSLRVSTSANLKTATQVYTERHDGRVPPPMFGEWYEFSKETTVIDEFPQIDRDLAAFRKLPPSKLRQAAEYMATRPDVASISIKGGKASHSKIDDSTKIEVLEDLVIMISKFSKYLPDMLLPVNLGSTPRVLTALGGLSRGSSFVSQNANNPKMTRSEENQSPDSSSARRGMSDRDLASGTMMPALEYRRLLIEACPLASDLRRNPHWRIGEFCERCAAPHSQGQLLSSFEKSLQVCSQPDLTYLHGLFMTKPKSPPYTDLLPLFGPFKTDGFSDIVIPVPGIVNDDIGSAAWSFKQKYDGLFWKVEGNSQGFNDQTMRGSQKFRLLHLILDPNPDDRVTMAFPKPESESQYYYEVVSASEADIVTPFSVSTENLTECNGPNCLLLEQTYRFRDDIGPSQASEYRYVMEIDQDDGPSPTFIQTLRSQSVPFWSTIFRSWYTDRLTPWLHFVPIDPRYQGLHTTYSYFTGTEGRANVNGRQTNVKARLEDGEYIAVSGQKWAKKALDEKHQEVYLFRLLIEWARLTDDRREEIGFRQDEKGNFYDDDWTALEEEEGKVRMLQLSREGSHSEVKFP